MAGSKVNSNLVVSLGGNALLPPGGGGTLEEQYRITRATMEHVVELIADGHRVLLTHGNGPIVGNILIRNEAAREIVPPMPLDICGADSQGGIGYMIQQTLRNLMVERGIEKPLGTVVTQVVVDIDDPAFQNPTKPIGPFYSQDEAKRLSLEKGWRLVQDSGRGWRRVVPSPRPLEIVELDFIKSLYSHGNTVIAAGGGGIPVVRESSGNLRGVEAVIDKDRATTVLANALGADGIVIVTAVGKVSLNFGTEHQQDLDVISMGQAIEYLSEGHFPAGSMGPKMESAIDFLKSGGKFVLITSPGRLREALRGEDGTRITRD
ncbi:MAG: carbamate kinase [Candidatus Eisenbacteria bacterium]|uniref:Carbamate kinase n=1 Tax=Eiseniibacteriota bacterium TaxID=2212470 RepID=A0A948RZ42_UNCEI|nr:carbamate kinase [Candidatus Eisenbacteria bacterium]MBU1947734.1 carbamate kinase [Candidatus Eisenbacteria bacterium]MBU2691797.1 carbamate kinase [Candidatus Eisenbacteria bacterium]